MSAARILANLYQSLAEVLAEPPDWMQGAGQDWLLYADALALAQVENDPILDRIVSLLAMIPAESFGQRRARYEALFSGSFWLYESLARDGRLAGPITFAVWQAYEAVGLSVADSSLPDHVSVELAFLAYLASQEEALPSEAKQWRKARRLFIKHHAGQWLPSLGQALSHNGDEVYSVIGLLLADVLSRDCRPRQRRSTKIIKAIPELPQPEACNLCGFCVQVCPPHALAVHETDESTALWVSDTACISCSKCVKVCSTKALVLQEDAPSPNHRVMRQSARACCPTCGAPTVSQAELDAIAVQLGSAPDWLKYCLPCRAKLMDKSI